MHSKLTINFSLIPLTILVEVIHTKVLIIIIKLRQETCVYKCSKSDKKSIHTNLLHKVIQSQVGSFSMMPHGNSLIWNSLIVIIIIDDVLTQLHA